MAGCVCNLAGMVSTNYRGIVSASINGSTQIEVADNGLVLLGHTTNSLSLTAHPFPPGGDKFMGVRCPSSVNVSLDWEQKYDCFNKKMYFIPKLGGRGSVVGDRIQGVTVLCDPNIVQESMEANAQGGPTTFAIDSIRKDIYGISYTGGPIPINTLSSSSYTLYIGSYNIKAYLQSFNIEVRPPSPASASYTFIF